MHIAWKVYCHFCWLLINTWSGTCTEVQIDWMTPGLNLCTIAIFDNGSSSLQMPNKTLFVFLCVPITSDIPAGTCDNLHLFWMLIFIWPVTLVQNQKEIHIQFLVWHAKTYYFLRRAERGIRSVGFFERQSKMVVWPEDFAGIFSKVSIFFSKVSIFFSKGRTGKRKDEY